MNFLQGKHSCYFTSVWKIKIKSSYIDPEKKNLHLLSYYFEAFWCFTKFCFHHKWNRAWSSVINMVYTNCRTILGNEENSTKSKNFIESSPSTQSSTKRKLLLILAKNYWKIEIKTFLYSAISHESSSLSQIFCKWL